MNDISCNTVEKNLSAFWDKEIDEKLSTQIKNHLCDCIECRRKFYELIKMEYLLKNYFNKHSTFERRGNRIQALSSANLVL